MKIFKVFFFLALTIGLFLTSCSEKEEDPVFPTSLTISLTNKDETAVPGAIVKLYKSEEDMQKQVNQVALDQTSDQYGRVTFQGLDPIPYFWTAREGCKNNLYSISATNGAIRANLETKVTSLMESTGTVVFANFSTATYNIHLDGRFMFRAGSESTSIYTIPVGKYHLMAIQDSHNANFPYHKTLDITLTCGGIITFSFPN